jgi:hypothetical protein
VRFDDADRRIAMRNLSLRTVGNVCGILTAAIFVVGIALVVSSGVQNLIPETGQESLH